MYTRVELPGGVWLKRHEDTPAESVFRAAWQTFMLTKCGEQKPGHSARICPHCAAAMLLDETQHAIASGPDDPRWIEFVDTIPGYYDYWEARLMAEEQAKAE
jgi:hypothetical protein